MFESTVNPQIESDLMTLVGFTRIHAMNNNLHRDALKLRQGVLT